MTISDRILTLRKASGLSQEELADRLGVSRQSVSKWESEQSAPDLERIIAISELFEVSTDYLLRGIEQPKTAAQGGLAPVLSIVATAMNAIGVALACLIWYQTMEPAATLAGVVFLVLGVMLYFIGQTGASGAQRGENQRRFWRINIWLVVFVPLSCLLNLVVRGMIAPYPLLWYQRSGHGVIEIFLRAAAFLGIYVGFCLPVSLKLRGKK